MGLLLLAGVAGMVFLLPASPAHAASATVTLSTLSGGVLTAAASGTVGSTLVITGTGFTPAATITIQSTVGSTTVNWLTAGSCTTVGGGTGSANSLTTTTTGSKCLTTTASGGFQTTVTVPAMTGGAQTIKVSDGANTVSQPFTVSSKVALTTTGNNNFGFPEEAIGTTADTFTLSGFGATETVTVATTAFTTASFGTTSCVTNTLGSCSFTDALVIADQNSGSKAITATGGTSALTASTTFTVNPWAAFYNSAAGKTSFAFPGSAPTSVLIEAHGLAAGTIAANSITIGGVGTSHSSITVGTSGAFGGVSGQVVVAPTAQVPFGQAAVVIGGITFNYASGNIALGAGTWGGALISSIGGVASSSTSVMVVDTANYKPGTIAASTSSPAPPANQIGFFGYGFVPNTGCGASTGGAITLTTPAAVTFSTVPTFQAGTGGVGGGSGVAKPDCNGALFGTAVLSDTPGSSASTPTLAASYTETVTQAAGAANFLSPSFGITPWDAIGTTTVDYTTTAETITVHGFSASEGVTATIGGSALTFSPACTTGATGTAACTSGANKVPDLASGAQNVVASGALSAFSVTSTGGVTYDPNVSGAGALSLNTGAPATTTILRTGTTYGPHGLAANTAYNIVWNSQGGSQTLGSFTSTATGGVPIPGIQFPVPSDVAGFHTFDIQTSSGATALYGGTLAGDTSPSTGAGALTGQYGDLVFSLTGLLSATPGVATIGAPETLSGGGLTGGTSYVIALGSGAGTVSTTAPALATFVASSAGQVPAGTTITLSDTASTTETGTVMYLSVQTAAHFGVSGSSDAYAKFVLAASGSNNMTAAPSGHGVIFTGHGLNAGGIYNLIFNYVQSPLTATSYTGTTVGVLAPNSVGTGAVSWNVPPTVAPGTYVVTLVVSTAGAGGLAVGSAVLDTPALFTVGGTSGSCSNQGTSCMTASSPPAQGKVGGLNVIQATYTNNSNAPQTAVVYAVIHNALGQTVAYTTATISPNAGGSTVAQLVLFGLAPGTYSATVFATSTGGVAVSGTSTVSVTI